MPKTLSVIIIGLLCTIIFVQLTCNKSGKVTYPDYTEQLKALDQKIDSLKNSIEQKEFIKKETRNEYYTTFLADTSTNNDSIYWTFKIRLDSLGTPRFN